MDFMKNLELEINDKLELIKKMIQNNENRDKIEEQRKELDKLLKQYIKEI